MPLERTDGPRGSDRASLIARIFAGFATAVLIVVVARVAQLKAAPSEQLGRFVSDRVSIETEPSPRGDLLDRRGRPLSMSQIGFRVILDPVAAEGSMDRVIVTLAERLGISADEIGDPLARAVSRNAEILGARADILRVAGPGEPLTLSARLRSLFGKEPVKHSVAGGAVDETGDGLAAKKLRRYLPVGPIIERDIADVIEGAGLPGVLIEKLLVRRYPGGDEIASILGKVGFGHAGLLGAERTLDTRLTGEQGRIGYVRDSKRRPVLIDSSSSAPGERGEDIRLSIDLELQRIAIAELERGMEDADAAGGRLVMMRPETGEILAMVDLYRDIQGLVDFPWVEPGTANESWPVLPPEDKRPRYMTLAPDPGRSVHPAMGRNRCVEDIYEPGSTFKSFVWASAWQMGLIGEGEIISTRPYTTPFGRYFEDVTKRDEQDWEHVLVHSSNVGMVKLSERMSHEQLRETVLRFGFGQRTRIGLAGEAFGLVTSAKAWGDYSHTSVAIGHEVAVTPVQMVRAFGAYARSGDLAGTLPHLKMTVPSREEYEAEPIVRVLEPEIALRTRSALVKVAARMDVSMRRRFPETPEPGYTLFGKSGTADIAVVPPFTKNDKGERVQMGKPKGAGGYYYNQYCSSFIGGAPAENPRLVVIAVIDDPGPVRIRQKAHYGSSVAGPVVRRVMERSLRYLGVVPGGDAASGHVASAGSE